MGWYDTVEASKHSGCQPEIVCTEVLLNDEQRLDSCGSPGKQSGPGDFSKKERRTNVCGVTYAVDRHGVQYRPEWKLAIHSVTSWQS